MERHDSPTRLSYPNVAPLVCSLREDVIVIVHDHIDNREFAGLTWFESAPPRMGAGVGSTTITTAGFGVGTMASAAAGAGVWRVGSGVGAGVGASVVGAGVEMSVATPAHPQVTAKSPLSGTEVTPSPSVSPSVVGSDAAV